MSTPTSTHTPAGELDAAALRPVFHATPADLVPAELESSSLDECKTIAEPDMAFFEGLMTSDDVPLFPLSLNGVDGPTKGALVDVPTSSNRSSDGSDVVPFCPGSDCTTALPQRRGSPSFSEQSTASMTLTRALVASDDGSIAGTAASLGHGAATATQQYVLVRLDNEGNVLRPANDDDVQLLSEMLASDAPQPMVAELAKASSAHNGAPPSPSARAKARTPAPRASASTAGQRKPGGPCHHCGATESPQWRRGPATKPVLCNACGTRYRRTNQLGANGAASAKDRLRAGPPKKRQLPGVAQGVVAKAVKV